MNILKKLFPKKPGMENLQDDIHLPVSITKNTEAYIKALMEEVLKEEGFESLKQYGDHVYLDWGDGNSSHILYFGVLDLPILMEPENNGWKATRVHIDRLEKVGEPTALYKNMTFLLI